MANLKRLNDLVIIMRDVRALSAAYTVYISSVHVDILPTHTHTPPPLTASGLFDTPCYCFAITPVG